MIDGFNLYHSLRDAARELTRTSSGTLSDAPTASTPQRSTRWLDLRALCASYLHVIGGGVTLSGAYEAIVIVSADSDLLPAVRTARRLRPDVDVWIAFPYRRGSKDLRATAGRTFKITKHQYAAHQLADPVVLPDGGTLHKPATW